MNKLAISPRVWPTVAAETLQYWLRRHRTMILVVGVASLAAGLITVSGTSSGRGRTSSLAMGYVPIIAGLMAMSGIVRDERDSGLLVMWLQKPGTLQRAYLLRYVMYQCMIALLSLGIAAIVAFAGAYAGVFTAHRAIRIPLGAMPMAMIPAAIVFACSAWGVRRDAVCAVAVIALSSTLCVRGLEQDIWGRISRVVCYPLDSIAALTGHAAYDSNLTRPLLIVTGHLIAWTLIALLGLRFTERAVQRGG